VRVLQSTVIAREVRGRLLNLLFGEEARISVREGGFTTVWRSLFSSGGSFCVAGSIGESLQMAGPS
jgi:hypothetical protein